MATIEDFIKDVKILCSLEKDRLATFKKEIKTLISEIDPKEQPLEARKRIREIFGSIRFLDPLVFAILVKQGGIKLDDEEDEKKVLEAAESVLEWFKSEFPKEEFAPLHEILDFDSELLKQRFAEEDLPFSEVKRIRVERFSVNRSKDQPFIPWIRLTLIGDQEEKAQVLELKWYDALWLGETLIEAVKNHVDILSSVLPQDSIKWDLLVSKVKDVRRAVDELTSLIEAMTSDSDTSSGGE